MMDSDRKDMLWLGAILLVALALRLWGLNAPLWYDEILTVETHLRLPWAQMTSDYSMNHHYLHDLFAKASMQVLGEDPAAIRLPAMLMGLGSIAAVWVLARALGGSAVAHATALLLALSYHHIWFSQNARGYTGLALFGTIGMILFLRGMRAPDRATWAWFAVMLAASVFTHLTGAFLFAALGLVWLGVVLHGVATGLLDRRILGLPLMGFILGGLLSILLYLPIIPGILASISEVSGTSAVDRMQEYQNPLWTLAEGLRTGFGSQGAMVTVAGLGVALLVLLGTASVWRRDRLFPLSVLAHVVLTVVLLTVVGMRIWPRFFFVDIGLVLILIVLGVRLICSVLERGKDPAVARIIFPLAVLLMAVVSVPLLLRNYAHPKQDLAGAVALVEATRKPGERVFAVGHASTAFTGHFHTDWTPLFTVEEFDAAMAAPGPVTFVVAFPGRAFRNIPALDADANPALTEVKWFPGTLGDGGVVVLHRD
jgi:hypothetical protein